MDQYLSTGNPPSSSNTWYFATKPGYTDLGHLGQDSFYVPGSVMSTEQFANKPVTTLNGAINGAVTSVVVVDASLFPLAPQFRILVESEYMLVTGVTGNTFTVTRGVEGSSAVPHLSGAPVIHVLTAGALETLRSASGLKTTTTVVDVESAIAPTTGQALVATDATHATWQSVSSGGLKTTTTVVDVESAIAPTTGQALVATDSTHATWQSVSSGGPKTLYLPLMSGLLSSGSTYTLLGLLPPLDYSTLGVGSVVFSFVAYINIPTSSTAQVRLYDVTNSNTIFESGILNGPQVEYNAGDTPIVLAPGASMLEFWLATPTITGGPATCFAAGILATFS